MSPTNDYTYTFDGLNVDRVKLNELYKNGMAATSKRYKDISATIRTFVATQSTKALVGYGIGVLAFVVLGVKVVRAYGSTTTPQEPVAQQPYKASYLDYPRFALQIARNYIWQAK